MSPVDYAKNIEMRGNVTSGMDRITDVPRCRVIVAGTLAIAVSGAPTKINFDTTPDFDSDGFFTAADSTTRVTIRTAGTYDVKAFNRWGAGSAGVQRAAWVSKNNVAFKYGLHVNTFPSATATATNNIATSMSLNAGDYLELLVLHDFGASLSTSNGGGDSVSSEMIVCLIST